MVHSWLTEFEDVELTIGCENPQILVSTAYPGTIPPQIQMDSRICHILVNVFVNT